MIFSIYTYRNFGKTLTEDCKQSGQPSLASIDKNMDEFARLSILSYLAYREQHDTKNWGKPKPIFFTKMLNN